ncbi:MAG: class I SAM-dependent methyltransferase [Acidimicrobiales bacterium]
MKLNKTFRALTAPLVRRLRARIEAPVRTDLAHLAHRVEFVRREILFELRYGRESEVRPEASAPRILSPQKLAAMAGDVRLNLGAGHLGRADYLNVDSRELAGIDVVADAADLPFEPASVTEIYSAHMLEHFPLEQLRRTLLPYWVGLLRDGGRFVAVVPDTETMIAEYVAGRLEFDELREVLYGGQEYEGDFHYNGFSRASLRWLMEEAGLCEVEVRAFGRRNGLCYEMELAGVRSITL